MKRMENYQKIELKDVVHKVFFFDEHIKGKMRYFEMMRVISPIFSSLISYRKRISNGIYLIGLEKDINAFIREMKTIIDSVEGCTATYRANLRKIPKDCHKTHLIADARNEYIFTVASGLKQLSTYLWGKRILAHENRDTLEEYFKTHLLTKKQRKVRWQTV